MRSPAHGVRACLRRSTRAIRLKCSAIVKSGLLRSLRFTGVRPRRQEKPPASPPLGPAVSGPCRPGGGPQPLDAADARHADIEQAVDVASLEEVDTEGLAQRHRFLAAAPAQDRAGAAEAGDQVAELLAPRRAAAAQHVRVPHDLDEIEAEPLAVDEGQGQVGDAVEADAGAARLDEVAREDIGAEIGEDVDRLQLEDGGAARPRLEIGGEAEEAVGEQPRAGELDAAGPDDP